MAHILVIDDTKNIRNTVRLTLEHAGHSVETAEDGAEGLEKFGDGSQWDLVLVDQRMPSMEGRDFVIAARQRQPQARIIMMTAFATRELAAEVLQIGATDFLRKPFSTEALRGAVDSALSHPAQVVQSSSAPETPLPSPGQDGFTVPPVFYRINGFSFWPVFTSPEESRAQGIEFGRVFQVRSPRGEISRCLVGITPHIRDQIQREHGNELADNDPIWEKLCGESLLNFIWEKATLPPHIMPVYEIPTGLQRTRSPMPWAPFGG